MEGSSRVALVAHPRRPAMCLAFLVELQQVQRQWMEWLDPSVSTAPSKSI
jgi:hypothetical protein